MYRATIRIERVPMVTPRRPAEENTPELMIQIKGATSMDAMSRAIRLLASERDAMLPTAEPVPVTNPFDDDEED